MTKPTPETLLTPDGVETGVAARLAAYTRGQRRGPLTGDVYLWAYSAALAGWRAAELRLAEAERDTDRAGKVTGKPDMWAILGERIRQDQKWGEQNHDDWKWLAIVTEELGEAAQAILKVDEENGSAESIRKEIVETAASALAWLECIRRRAALAPGDSERRPDGNRTGSPTARPQ